MIDRQKIAERALTLLSSESPLYYEVMVRNFSMSAARVMVIKLSDVFNRARAELQKEETQALTDRLSGQT